MRISDWSSDVCSSDLGLRLHYRDYEGASHRPPILCLPGLTRNARDFEPVANRLAGQWRLICPEMRGRAASSFAKAPMTRSEERLVGTEGICLGRFRGCPSH